MNVIELTADEVRELTADALQARGVPLWALVWILDHRTAGAVRIDEAMKTITPLRVLEGTDR